MESGTGVKLYTSKSLEPVSYCLVLCPHGPFRCYSFLQCLCHTWRVLSRYLLVHLPRHSTQPFLSSAFQPTKCCSWQFVLVDLPKNSLCHPHPMHQGEGSEEEKNLFFLALCKSFLLLVFWPRYFVFASDINPPPLGLPVLEHKS